jgi:8-amino-7-oxononanoate synthase
MLIKKLQHKMTDLAQANLLRKKWIGQSKTDTHQLISSSDHTISDNYTLFCSNDYLGFANHPEILDSLRKGVDLWGGGSGASHLISGHMAPHEQLEKMLSQLFSQLIPDGKCLTFSTGYMANLAVMTVLGDGDCEIFSDELNHASLIDGIRLSKAQVSIYKHRDYEALEKLLKQSNSDMRLIVSDGVFSMDGDQADLSSLCDLAVKYDAWVVVDDAHGYGVLGEEGLGSLEVASRLCDRIILIGTLGKAAGLSGAFVIAHQTIVDFIFQSARSYIYTTAALPAISFALLTSLKLMHGAEGKHRRAQLRLLEEYLRRRLSTLAAEQQSQFDVRLTKSLSPIQGVIVGDAQRAIDLSSGLHTLGFRVPGIRPPTVPAGTSRIRLTLSADHTTEDIDRFMGGLQMLFKKMS